MSLNKLYQHTDLTLAPSFVSGAILPWHTLLHGPIPRMPRSSFRSGRDLVILAKYFRVGPGDMDSSLAVRRSYLPYSGPDVPEVPGRDQVAAPLDSANKNRQLNFNMESSNHASNRAVDFTIWCLLEGIRRRFWRLQVCCRKRQQDTQE